MAILSKGTDFSTGDQVTAAKLDALVDNATFASDAVDNSTTALDTNGKIIVKDGGITSAKLPSGGLTSNLKITSGGTVFPNSPDNGYLQISNSDGSNVLALDPNELLSKTSISLRCAQSSHVSIQNVNAAGDGAVTNMRIQEGKVGIGTTSPEATLHIDDNDTEGPVLLLEGASATEGDITVRSGEALQVGHWDNTASEPNKFIERLRIDSNGQTIIGQTTTPTAVAGSLFVAGRIGSLNTYSQTTSSSANLVIQSTGLLQRSTSSARYKKNIEDYTKGIDEVKLLRPVSFQSNNENDDKTYAGLIAEEVHDAGLTEFVDYNEEGQPDAIHYSNIVSLLTKALQESITKIESLEARVAALES